jgi:hypothetical protein
MMLTLEELAARIAERVDEITILELLDINAEELVSRFMDKLEGQYDNLIEEYDDEEQPY